MASSFHTQLETVEERSRAGKSGDTRGSADIGKHIVRLVEGSQGCEGAAGSRDGARGRGGPHATDIGPGDDTEQRLRDALSE